ncbi:S8 family serine peptidase [Herbaspirillum rubrisubalbicans]|uniref:S8 family serine peptidase n=1 Tax=Herbaspirillum rubrisubalbicans TaxID=80842 RepID=UPI00215E05D5|nr:S8 family serine peptidase [Herbaspirillum rubrisubalbicans]
MTSPAGLQKKRLCGAVLLTLGLPASAQSYVNYDGSSSTDVAAAVASWATNTEFKTDWGLGAMNAQYAYAAGFSGLGIKLGSVDSGLLLTHAEFVSRDVKALAVIGTYANDGSQYQDGSQPWKAGDAFSTTGALSTLNDKHGSHVSGSIAAAKNGAGIMGVAFASDYYITNTNGTDSSVYGVNMDYNYFKAAYGNLASAGVRVINSSWGSPDSRDDFGSISGVAAAYQRLQGGGKKTWLDAAADVAQASNTLMVWAAGNTGKANVNIRSALPYFRPELEQNWIAVAAINASSVLPSFSNQCGLAKYWCLSAPGSAIPSLNITSDTALVNASGTSMAAPHVTGALGVLMERYPNLDNQAIRTILLTTSTHLGSGAVDVPNAMFGWGLPDLKKALNGPAQLLGVFNANIGSGVSDTWSNDISEAALVQRKSEDKAQLAAWQALSVSTLQAAVDSATAQVTSRVNSGYDAALALVQTRAQRNATYQASKKKEDNTAFQNADKAVAANPLAAAILKQSGTGALLSKEQLLTYVLSTDTDMVAANLALGNYKGQTAYLDAVQKKTDADYVGTLVKSGAGVLTLSGNNSYSGGTRLEGGTLAVASATALGSGALGMNDGTTLRAAADGLALGNAVSLNGEGRIDTQAFMLTLNAGIADGSGKGSLVKQGEGTLRVLGPVRYSGNTTIAAGTLSVPSFAQTSDQILTVGVASATQYGKLAVTGTASFASGARLAVDVTKAATLARGQTLGGVITAGSLSAPSLNVSDNSLLFDFQPLVANNAVDLNIVDVVSIQQVVKDTLAPATVAAAPAAVITPVASTPTSSTSAASASVENTPAASTPAASTPVENTPAASAPAASTPAVSTPTVSTPAASTPAVSTPAVSTPAVSTPAVSTPAVSTPAASTPAVSTPAVSTPAASTPVASTPVASTPAVSTPAASTPAVSTPAASTPAVSTPAVSTPAVSTPAVSTPAVSTPAVSTPAVSTPAVSTPAVSTPAVASTPAASTPAVSTPAARTPAASTPAANTPVANAPAASTQAASTQAASTQATNTQATNTQATNTQAASTQATNTQAGSTPAANTSVASTPVASKPAASTSAASTLAAPPPAFRTSLAIASATAAAPVAPVLDRQIQHPSSGDMAQVVTALGRLPDATSLMRAASQTLPRNDSASAIRGSQASLNRVIATRVETGSSGIEGAGAGSGLAYGEAGADRQVWIMPFESRTNQGDRGGASGFSASTWGMAAGAEMELERGRVGVSYAYAGTSTSGNTAIIGTGSRSRIESNMLALYGSVALGELALGWQADLGWNGNRLARDLQFGGLNRIASSRYHSWSAHVGANVSHTLSLSEALSLAPALQLDYTRLQSPAYAESGAGDLSLLVQGKRSQALLLGVAARLNYAVTTASQISSYLGASYDAINDRDDLVATYAGAPGQAFAAPGTARSPWLFKAGVSYRYKLMATADITLRLDAEGRSGFINQSAALKAGWRF